MSTTEYFVAMAERANVAGSCAELQLLNVNVNASVGATLTAIAAQIVSIEAQALLLYNDIAALTAHIATLTGTQTALTAVGTVSATAAAVSDLGSAIAYIKAQGAPPPKYLAANTLLTIGQFDVDTTAAPLTLTLPASPSLDDSVFLNDPFGSWSTNSWTLARNGQTIMGLAEDMTVAIAGENFRITFDGTTWRLS